MTPLPYRSDAVRDAAVLLTRALGEQAQAAGWDVSIGIEVLPDTQPCCYLRVWYDVSPGRERILTIDGPDDPITTVGP